MVKGSRYHRSARDVAVPQAPNGLTERQVDAIRTAMRLFVEEDLARGVLPQNTRLCSVCRQPRSAAGFVTYADFHLCNQCATEYEISRAQGIVKSISDFPERRAKRGAGVA
jgi:hypothetical protein